MQHTILHFISIMLQRMFVCFQGADQVIECFGILPSHGKHWRAWPRSFRNVAYISISKRPRGCSTATPSKVTIASPAAAAPASVCSTTRSWNTCARDYSDLLARQQHSGATCNSKIVLPSHGSILLCTQLLTSLCGTGFTGQTTFVMCHTHIHLQQVGPE